MILYRKICMWLKAKGTPFSPDQFSISNDGTAIARWDEVLGRRPTAADLEPFDPQMEDLANWMRLKRDQMLAACDWTVLPHTPLGVEALNAWVAYRQALRDITRQEYFPRRVTWPEEPPR